MLEDDVDGVDDHDVGGDGEDEEDSLIHLRDPLCWEFRSVV